MNASRILTASALAAVLGLVACATPVENAEDPTGHTSEALRPRPDGPDGPPPPIYYNVSQCVAQDFESYEFEQDLVRLGCYNKEVTYMTVLASTGKPVNGLAGFAAECPGGSTDITTVARCPDGVPGDPSRPPGSTVSVDAIQLAQCFRNENPTHSAWSFSAPPACTPTSGVTWIYWDPTCHGSGCSIRLGL